MTTIIEDHLFDRTVALIARSSHQIATAESRFAEDLKFDSIDLVHLISELEQEFGVIVTEDHLRTLQTVGDAVRVVRSLTNGGIADA